MLLLNRGGLRLPFPTPFVVPVMLSISILGSILPSGNIRSFGVTSSLCYVFFAGKANPTGDPVTDELSGIQAAVVLAQWISFHLLHTAETEYRRILTDTGAVSKETPRKQEVELLPSTFLQRLRWATSLKLNLRGVGWNWKVKNVPPVLPQSNWQFVRNQLSKAFGYYYSFDLIWYSLQSSVYGSPHPPLFFSDSIPRQVLFAWVGALASYYSIHMPYSLVAAVTVSSGVCKPEDWPPLMGKLKDVITVRDLWGKFWHQCLRRILGVPYELLNRAISIQRGTLLSRYVQLYMAFLASACLHHFPYPQAKYGVHYSFRYFAMQPLAITLEDFVIYCGKKAGIKGSRKTRAIGRLFTFIWFSFSLRYGTATQFSDGVFAMQQMPSLNMFLGGVIGRVLYTRLERHEV